MNEQPTQTDSSSDVAELARTLGIPFATSLSQYPSSADFVAKIPIAYSRQYSVLGVQDEQGKLWLACGEINQPAVIDVLCRQLGRMAHLLLCPKPIVQAAINEAYQQRTSDPTTVLENVDGSEVLDQLSRPGNANDLLDESGRAPVIRLINLVLFEAVKAGASDVHLQPYEQDLIIRYRIDGELYNSYTLPKSVQDEAVSRVKVMGRMNIAEKRLAQDGRATVQVGDKVIDLRIASVPTSFGERVVIRLLDKSARLYQLEELGMGTASLNTFRRLINVEHGLVLVTGPTGSGKTTTLYAALKEIDSTRHNILTLEDPIEYQLPGISQIQVSDKKGMTFASGLRSVLRQDPDIVMVGEIRDAETAKMAIQSALTGHLVFSTLHTNDAASAITRLLDLGIEPYLVASSIIGVLAQRLVRRICPRCKQSVILGSADRIWLGTGPEVVPALQRGSGCERCRMTGFNGRLGIFELLRVDDAIRRLIHQRSPASEIRTAAIACGMSSLRDDGIRKILAGATTVDEVQRVTTVLEESATGSIPEETAPVPPIEQVAKSV